MYGIKPENISKLNKVDKRVLNLYAGLSAEAWSKGNDNEESSQLKEKSYKASEIKV